ncbi:MAG TPA: hypothetical protein QF753_19895 [Victivallales bacterium]|nr:hypothetical protein [Victivallales bacterium]
MANLHYYRPDKNNSISHAFKIFYHIINNSESIIDDMPAKDVLFSLNPGFKNKDIPATKVKYPIIIGSIEYLVKHKSVYKLKIKGLDKPIYVNNDAYKNIDNSSSHRIFNDEKLEGYDIAILQVGRRYFKNESCILTCVGINFDILTLDKNLLTFDSYHEYSFGNYLVESKRDFIKDISYIDTKNFTPDYILRDTCPETYVEIWGMNTDDYLTRKQEKLNLYNEIENPLLEWEPTKEKNFPELPKKYS